MRPLPELRLARVRLARVAQHERWFADAYLHPAERERAAALSLAKRRIDFIAGRVAGKRALGLCATEIQIVPEVGAREGAPRALASDGGALTRAISISHGGGWGCAAVARCAALGLDVERIEPRHRAFLDEAFAPGELATWRAALPEGADHDATVTLAWCAKEAVLKLRGVGLRGALHACAVARIEWDADPLVPGPCRYDADELVWSQLTLVDEPSEVLRLAVWSDGELMLALAVQPQP